MQTNWKTDETVFEQRGVEFPDFWSVNASTIVTTKYFRGAVGTDAAGVEPAAADRPRGAHVRPRPGASTATSPPTGRRDLRARTDLDAAAPGLLVQLPGVVQRRHARPAAGERLLHPGRRRHDGLDPELVPRRGPDLQGRLRRRPEHLAHPLEQGAAALLRGHGLRPGVVHARRRRLRRHDQVRRRDPAGGEDGRARRRSPRHRGVHRDQGPRGGEDPRPARRRLRHGPRRQGHHAASSTRTPTTRCGCRTSSCARWRRATSSGCGRAPTARSSRPSTPSSCSARWPRRPGRVPIPGIQYDDTINDWHTNPESGRITASNPCSEYMSLDNSSCNLASLNLLKFLRPTTARSTPSGSCKAIETDHHRDGHLHLLRGLPDRGDRRHDAGLPPAGHRLREPGRAADGLRACPTTPTPGARWPRRSPA